MFKDISVKNQNNQTWMFFTLDSVIQEISLSKLYAHKFFEFGNY